MRWLALLALLALALPAPAEARHCRSGQILRVSMGRCVSAYSHLAYGYVWRNRHHRYREAYLQQEEEGQVDERERRARPKPPPGPTRHQPQMLQVIEPAPAEPIEVEIPYGIYGSRMMRPRFHHFDWISP